jgi:hypothetical protein
MFKNVKNCRQVTAINNFTSKWKLLSILLVLIVTSAFGLANVNIASASSVTITYAELEDSATAVRPFAIAITGECTSSSPMLISTAVELANLAVLVNQSGNALAKECFGNDTPNTGSDVYIELTADINLNDLYGAGLSWTDPGETAQTAGWVPIGNSTNKFLSIFNGNGHKVTNLRIGSAESPADLECSGLFGYTNGAEIKNIGVDANIYINLSGNAYAGGLIGFANNSSQISNSYATGNVSATSDSSGDAYVGGLIGRATNSSHTSNSYATGNVTAESSSGNASAGGLIGVADNSSTSNSYATGNVLATPTSSSTAYAGGLIGVAVSSSTSNSYATGNVLATSTSSSTAYAGGLIGSATTSSTSNSYATGNVSATFTSSGYAFAGGLIGYVHSTSSVTNSVALNKLVSASGSSVYAGRVVGASDGALTNNYAYADMQLSTNGGTSWDTVADGALNNKNGLNLEPFTNDGSSDSALGKQLSISSYTGDGQLWQNTAKWNTGGTNSVWNCATIWHCQPGWLPVLASSVATTSSARVPVAFNASITPNTIGNQDGNWIYDPSPYTISFSPGVGVGSTFTPAADNTDADGVLATLPPFGSGDLSGFAAPSGTTFSSWCQAALASPPANICSSEDIILPTATAVQFYTDTTLTAVYKWNPTTGFTGTPATNNITNNGRIDGVTAEYEYSNVGNSATVTNCASASYTVGTGAVTGLSGSGTKVCLRKKAITGVLASDAQLVVVPAGPPPPQPTGVEIHRLHNPVSGEHHYTSGQNEISTLVTEWGWIDEGVGWTAPTSGTPVTRLHNPVSGEHHYTKDTNEISTLINEFGWVNEDIGWWSLG